MDTQARVVPTDVGPGVVRSGGRIKAGALTLAALALLVGACELRLETPPPSLPSPDAIEVVRDRHARSAAGLAELATRAATNEPVELAGLLLHVAEVSQAHATTLGGVYVPFPDATARPSPAPTTRSAPVAPGDATAVMRELADAAAEARTDSGALTDPDLARLLAAIAVSRTVLADTLADALGAARSTVVLVVPPELPAGLSAADAAVLVLAEDAAGMVFEVAAARSAEPARATAAARAALHRDRAQAWAAAAGIAGTAEDPRRAAYDLPAELIVAGATQDVVLAIGAQVEADLGVTYGTLIAATDARGRKPFIDAMVEYSRVLTSTGATPPAFPCLAERA